MDMTVNEVIACVVILGAVALLIFAAGIYADRRGYKRGVKEGRKQGVAERDQLQHSLSRLEGLARQLQTQLTVPGVSGVQTAEHPSGAGLSSGPGEPERVGVIDDPEQRSVSPLSDRLAARVQAGADAHGARSYDGSLAGESSYGAADSIPELVEVELPKEMQDTESRDLAAAIDEFTEPEYAMSDADEDAAAAAAQTAQTERVEDPAKPGEIGHGSEPYHGWHPGAARPEN